MTTQIVSSAIGVHFNILVYPSGIFKVKLCFQTNLRGFLTHHCLDRWADYCYSLCTVTHLCRPFPQQLRSLFSANLFYFVSVLRTHKSRALMLPILRFFDAKSQKMRSVRQLEMERCLHCFSQACVQLQQTDLGVKIWKPSLVVAKCAGA
jgi:hypothetical protein